MALESLHTNLDKTLRRDWRENAYRKTKNDNRQLMLAQKNFCQAFVIRELLHIQKVMNINPIAN